MAIRWLAVGLIAAVGVSLAGERETIQLGLIVLSDPDDAASPPVLRLNLDLRRARTADKHRVGWRIERITALSTDGETSKSLVDPVLPADLWWVAHADADRPRLAEFRTTPQLCGALQDSDGTAQLEYCLRSVPCRTGSPSQCVLLDYHLIDAKTGDTTRRGDDEPGIIDDSEDPPGEF